LLGASPTTQVEAQLYFTNVQSGNTADIYINTTVEQKILLFRPLAISNADQPA